MKLAILCPACGRGDQFIQPVHLNAETPDTLPVTCLCGTTTTLGVLRQSPDPKALADETERLAAEAARRAFGDLLK